MSDFLGSRDTLYPTNFDHFWQNRSFSTATLYITYLLWVKNSFPWAVRIVWSRALHAAC